MTKSEEIEEWRLITEFPVYEASNLGRIRNKQTKRVLKHKKKRRQRPYYKDVASQFNVDRKVIEDIHKNKSWRHVK